MKPYTREEKEAATAAVPPPIRTFLRSFSLARLTGGIIEKHKMNFRQGGEIVNLIGVTLLGLEPASAFETNLHQALPELSNPIMRELVDDINDRVFKEAQRRLRENIFEPEPEWDEKTLGKKEDWVQPMKDDELHALAEKERAEGRAESKTVEDTGPEGPDESGAVTQEREMADIPDSGELPRTVAEQKTAEPTIARPGAESGTLEALSEKEQEKEVKAPGGQQKKRTADDPYREPVE